MKEEEDSSQLVNIVGLPNCHGKRQSLGNLTRERQLEEDMDKKEDMNTKEDEDKKAPEKKTTTSRSRPRKKGRHGGGVQ